MRSYMTRTSIRSSSARGIPTHGAGRSVPTTRATTVRGLGAGADADTGEYKWHYQQVPGDDWDYTSVQPIILTDLEINNVKRKVALHAPKNGFFYVIDRSNGRLVSAEQFATINWAAGIDRETGRPVVYEQARYGITGGDFLAIPGPFGAHNWHPMSYSPKTGPSTSRCRISHGYANDDNFAYKPGHGS